MHYSQQCDIAWQSDSGISYRRNANNTNRIEMWNVSLWSLVERCFRISKETPYVLWRQFYVIIMWMCLEM